MLWRIFNSFSSIKWQLLGKQQQQQEQQQNKIVSWNTLEWRTVDRRTDDIQEVPICHSAHVRKCQRQFRKLHVFPCSIYNFMCKGAHLFQLKLHPRDAETSQCQENKTAISVCHNITMIVYLNLRCITP